MTWYFRDHLNAAKLCGQHLRNNPLSTLLIMLIIAIALALPAGLFTLLKNAHVISTHWQTGTQISLFLKANTSSSQINDLLTTLRSHPKIVNASYISPEQGLQQFTNGSGFQDVLQQLPSNPLPPVIEVFPKSTLQTSQEVQSLFDEIRQLPEVETAQLDIQWLQRFLSILQLGQRMVFALFLLFSLAILLIIGNMIRFATQNQRKEIEVIRLIGATNSFIRRPFLYTGFFYGFGGGVLAWLVVSSLLWWLQGPIQHLVFLYNSQFVLQGLGIKTMFFLILISSGLGLLASYWVVNQYITEIEPK